MIPLVGGGAIAAFRITQTKKLISISLCFKDKNNEQTLHHLMPYGISPRDKTNCCKIDRY